MSHQTQPMKNITTTICLTFAVLVGSTGCTTLISYSGVSGEKLPPCSGQATPRNWTNCHGSYHVSNGEKYVGEFRDGKPYGQGTLTFSAPHKGARQKYVGEFRDGKPYGQGTLTSSAPHKAAGQKYVGEFRDSKPYGQGTLTSSAPHKGAGQKYVGEFRYGRRHGQGTHTDARGLAREGIWKNGKFQYAQKGTPSVTARKPSRRTPKIRTAPPSSASNENVCENAVKGKNWDKNSFWKNYVIEAKRRGLTPQKCILFSSSKMNKSAPPSKTNFEKAKKQCEELGFKKGTEKFGECVLRLSE
jgi:hypothetical protein